MRSLTEALVDGRVHSVAYVMRYAGRGDQAPLSDVVRSLAKEDAQHPPVYYLLAAAWTRAFGPSISSLRAVSVLLGCLAPFAVGWLCFELYGTRLAAALGFAFSGVSPVLVLYSQQAREYGLWAALIAASTALFLRASRGNANGWWVAYALCSICALYTDVLFITVLVSHAAYAAICMRGKRLAGFAIALAATLVSFAPWAVQIALHRRTIELSNAWTAGPWPLHMLVEKWAFNAGTTFFDLEYAHAKLAAVLAAIFIFTACAVYWNVARAPRAERIMTAALIAAPLLMLFLPDLVLHQHRSSVTRYGMSLWIALIVCVAGFMAAQLSSMRRRALLWGGAATAVLLASLISSIVDVRSPVWWDNRSDAQNLTIAHILNEQPSTLVVVPGNWARVFDLAFYLHPDVGVQMLPSHAAARPAPGFARAFLLARPTDESAFARSSGPLQIVYKSQEENAQVRSFRGTPGGKEYLSLWRFSNYVGTL